MVLPYFVLSLFVLPPLSPSLSCSPLSCPPFVLPPFCPPLCPMPLRPVPFFLPCFLCSQQQDVTGVCSQCYRCLLLFPVCSLRLKPLPRDNEGGKTFLGHSPGCSPLPTALGSPCQGGVQRSQQEFPVQGPQVPVLMFHRSRLGSAVASEPPAWDYLLHLLAPGVALQLQVWMLQMFQMFSV